MGGFYVQLSYSIFDSPAQFGCQLSLRLPLGRKSLSLLYSTYGGKFSIRFVSLPPIKAMTFLAIIDLLAAY